MALHSLAGLSRFKMSIHNTYFYASVCHAMGEDRRARLWGVQQLSTGGVAVERWGAHVTRIPPLAVA